MPLQFFLNGKKHVLPNADPTQTVLDYVRSIGLTGSKLGCSEGGCGACTVSLSEWDSAEGKARYYAINGCIVPLIAVDGKHLITVEGLGDAAAPHAVQERIAKFHGSQCGFCTPGIVMSLYSLLRATDGKPSQEEINEAFDGNLCRCTGYKPIIDAASTFVCPKGADCCQAKTNGHSNGHTENGVNGSAEIDMTTPNGLALRKYPHTELIFPPALRKYKVELLKLESSLATWYRPATLDQARDLLAQFPSAKLVGGASEFQIEAKIKGDEHPVCIYLGDVPELRSFEYVPGKGVKIGANIPLSILEQKLQDLIASTDAYKAQIWEAVITQLKYFAGRQIRNVATPAGNIATASPISDLNPVFTAANSEVEVLLSDNSTTSYVMGDLAQPFFVGYRRTRIPAGGMLSYVWIPESQKGDVVQTYKQAKRKDDDISIVTAAMRVSTTNGVITAAALAFGGVAPITVLAKTSQLLVGKPVASLASGLEAYISALDQEFALPYTVPGGMAVFRRSLIMSFFYKFSQSVLAASGLDYDDGALLAVTRVDKPVGVRDLTNNYEQEILGKSLVHVNALKQVTGEAIYVDDMPTVGRELHAAQVMSQKARARIASVDFTAAAEVPGFVGFVDIDDLPGENRWGAFKAVGPDRLFVEKHGDAKVEYVGDCIALVVAASREAATKAARLVRVEYVEEEEPIITIEQAIERNSFFDIPEAARPRVEYGDFDKCCRDVEAHGGHVIEGVCRIGAQEHFYLEPQGCLVVPEDNGAEYKIYASTQNPNETQLIAAAALNIPANRVVARSKRMGGGFGGKETRSVHYSSLAAVAARKFKQAVRLVPSRAEDMMQSGQRHPFLSKWKVALDKNNKFVGLRVHLFANAGYSMDLTKGVIDRAVLHVDNCYDFGPNIDVQCKACRTNVASNTAFRGFGGPQGMFTAESIIYEVSEKLGLDPEALRRINYYPLQGGRTHYRQELGDDFTVPIMAEKLLSEVKFDALRKEVDEFNSKSRWIKRGLAHVPTKFGISFGALFLNQAGALVHIYEDGSILLAHGGTEMGQGLHTKMTMICAHELGVPVSSVFVSETATNTVANASPTAASASSDLNGMAVKHACDQINERLKPFRAKLGADATMAELAHAAYFSRVNLSANGYYKTPDINFVWGEPNPGPAFLYYTQGSAVSMVEVDTLTGDWANLRTDIIMDIGRPINQAIDYGQIEGAFIQGQGLFTIEESLWMQSGMPFTRGPGASKITGFRDIPQHFNVQHLQDRPFSHLKTIHRSKGIGEPPLFLGAAVMFAIRDAIKAARLERGLEMLPRVEAPLTSENIRVAVGDSIALKSAVEVKGKPFTVRS